MHAECGIIWLGEQLFRLFLEKMVHVVPTPEVMELAYSSFPSDPVWSGPTKHGVLCEKHFTVESFDPNSAIASSMGLAKQKRLRPDAIPTIFER